MVIFEILLNRMVYFLHFSSGYIQVRVIIKGDVFSGFYGKSKSFYFLTWELIIFNNFMDVGKINTFLRKMILLKPLLLKYWFDLNSVLFSATRVCLQFRNRNFWRISENFKETKKNQYQLPLAFDFIKLE